MNDASNTIHQINKLIGKSIDINRYILNILETNDHLLKKMAKKSMNDLDELKFILEKLEEEIK